MFNQNNNLHFIGIGGSGISAIARWAKAIGKEVTGSDANENQTVLALRQQGIECYVGHSSHHLSSAADTVIFSEAIDKQSNPEYLEAKERGLKIMSYFEALGEISKEKKTIVVSGTHGKTTTTAMLGQALIQAGVDPSVVVGSRVKAFEDSNLHIGQSEWLVVEGCEYRRSFLYLQPFGVVLLNCEVEHLDYYQDEADYLSAFEALVAKIPDDGFLVYNQQDAHLLNIKQKAKGQSFGIDPSFADELDLHLKVMGDFNLLNASHAYKAASQITSDHQSFKKGLEAFAGTSRRMETKGEKEGVLVMDDYAHHPTEIRASLGALKDHYPDKRIICIFQPHQYSRTHQMLGEFEKAFKDADLVMIPNIYEARDTDEDKAKVSAESFVGTLSKNHADVQYTHNLQQTVDRLLKQTKPNDLIITMGAGDVYKVGEMFLRKK